MNKPIILLFIFLISTALLGAEVREVVILQTTDTHAAVSQMFASNKPLWPKLATLIKEEMGAARDKCLLVDCGDVAQGSLAASLSKGMAGLQPILTLPYDAWIPGNHELDFGIEAYRLYCKAAKDLLISANFYVLEDERPPAWRMFTRNGVRIAVIGMQASYYAYWLMPETTRQFHIEKAMKSLKTVLPSVCAEKPDMIVLAVHQAWFENPDRRGVNEVADIALRYPEIDLILGGHSHRRVPGCKIGLKTWYVQAGANGECLAVVKAKVDVDAHEVLDIQSSLKTVKPDTPEDPEMLSALAPFLEAEQKEANRETGIVLTEEVPSNGKAGIACRTSDLIAQAIADATGASAAIHSRLNEFPLPKGKILPKHLYFLIPYENNIVTAWVTAKELEEIMTEQWAQRDTYRFCGPWNAHFTIVDGKARLVDINGKPPEPDIRYLIAMNSHTAAGSGAFNVLRKIITAPDAKRVDTGISTRKATEDFLLKNCGNLSFKLPWLEKAKSPRPKTDHKPKKSH